MIVGRADIARAADVLRGVALRTPVLELRSLAQDLGIDLHAKAENLQYTGSFKYRGAFNAVASLSASQRARGVVTYSSGNHGQGLAAAAQASGIPAVVVMPKDAVAAKVAGVEKYGALPLLVGDTITSRQLAAEEFAAANGHELVPPADDMRVMAGQATIGLEILEQLPDVEAILVPIGGGGLISGVGSAVKAARPDVKIIGVEPAGKATAFQSFAEGRRVTLDEVATQADGLRANLLGVLNWAIMQSVVDDVLLAGEAAISEAIRLLAVEGKQVVEAAGAVSLAALLEGQPQLQGMRVVMILSGGNIGSDALAEAVRAPVADRLNVGAAAK